MINWEEIIMAQSEDELREAKLWLFQENMRLNKEKDELSDLQEQFKKERQNLKYEMSALSRRATLERERLKEENLFFERKMTILKDGFRMLEEDRQVLEEEKRRLKYEKSFMEEYIGSRDCNEVAKTLFRNVNNTMTLKKRYRDLVRIFHPDNLCGDEELAQSINKEFQHLKEEI